MSDLWMRVKRKVLDALLDYLEIMVDAWAFAFYFWWTAIKDWVVTLLVIAPVPMILVAAWWALQ